MNVGLMVTAFGDDDLADVAVHAENSGYDAVWVGELWGPAASCRRPRWPVAPTRFGLVPRS